MSVSPKNKNCPTQQHRRVEIPRRTALSEDQPAHTHTHTEMSYSAVWEILGKSSFVSCVCARMCQMCVHVTDGVCLSVSPGLWWLPFMPTVLSWQQRPYRVTQHRRCRRPQSAVCDLSEVKGRIMETTGCFFFHCGNSKHQKCRCFPSDTDQIVRNLYFEVLHISAEVLYK